MKNLFPKNKVFEKIENGIVPIGFFNYLKDTAVIEIAGSAGIDFAIIDTEHAVTDRETVERMIIAAQLNEVVPMVRMPDIIPWLMRSYLEMGAQGILIPHVNTAEQCRRAQDALRYPPDGHASTCRSIRADGYAPIYFNEYIKQVKEISLVALIEDPEGVENIKEILPELKPGRDMVMFGKADYAQVLGGMNPDGSYPVSKNDGYYKVIDACMKYKIWFMAVPSSPATGTRAQDVQKVITEGCSAVVLPTDQTMLLDFMSLVVNSCSGMKLRNHINDN